jgi:transketolase
MRVAFAETLASLAERDERILLLTADLGYLVLDAFTQRFPQRFFNLGVAEQNMVGVATGLAEAGYIPFVYSISPFASLRPYEFIRNGPIRHQLLIRIVGVGGGFDYGTAGFTHHGLEDIGVMRVQPGLTLVIPADGLQARRAILATWDLPGPVYYRLGKDDRLVVPGLEGRFELGKVERLGKGRDLLFVVTGSIATEVVGAAEILAKQGVNSSVLVVSSLNPAPDTDLVETLGPQGGTETISRIPLVFTVENHYINGGLGSWVSEVVAAHGLGSRVVRCGVRAIPGGVSGSPDYMNDVHGLSRSALVTKVISELGR